MPNNIPGNDHALEFLKRTLNSREAIAFVGAGASGELYPLWNELLNILSAQAVTRGLASESDRQYWKELSNKKPHQVVRGVKSKLSTPLYGEILRDTFRPKLNNDGQYFTKIHDVLLRIPFRGYLTTNYDPGLLEARLALRPDSHATGFSTWKDYDSINRWITGEIFEEQSCPILFAHGYYERSDTIVLGVGEYRDAYSSGPYRRLFESLWTQKHLVFIGFGFSDAWLDFVTDEIIMQNVPDSARENQHIAIIGLPSDKPYSPEFRQLFRDQYNATVLFYPVSISESGAEDHSSLVEILESLTLNTLDQTDSVLSEEAIFLERPPQCWTHETTNDDRFVQRPHANSRLNFWSDDSEVRVIAISGMGGLGKTALIGQWLKEDGGDTRRITQGLFFWSFYADHRVDSFLKALLQFAEVKLNYVDGNKNALLIQRANCLIESVPLHIVLDGLEVLQEGPGSLAYGTLLADDLREFLDVACRMRHGGLVVLTSRFSFSDLARYIGSAVRVLDLNCLTREECSELLNKCGVGGSDEARIEVGNHLHGHPLALRLFAATLSTLPYDNPELLYTSIFAECIDSTNYQLEDKLKRLLDFYEKQLPDTRIAILGIISLFRTPIPSKKVIALAGRLAETLQPLGSLRDDTIYKELEVLSREGLLLKENGENRVVVFSCHPILRDHFRRKLLSIDARVAKSVALYLTERPSISEISSLEELEPVVSSIEMLQEAGGFQHADELFRERLRDGYIFQRLPAYQVGFQCAAGFVSNAHRREQCEKELSLERLGYYWDSVALFASYSGESANASQAYRSAQTLYSENGDHLRLAISERNYGDLQVNLGHLAEAEAIFKRTLDWAQYTGNKREELFSLAHLAHVLGLQGSVKAAIANFELANKIQKLRKNRPLFSLRGILWAELLLRMGKVSDAKNLTEENIRYCEDCGWISQVGMCNYLLGRILTLEGQLDSADEILRYAENTVREGHMSTFLAKVLLAQAEISRRRREWDDALKRIDMAKSIFEPRSLLVIKADALVLQARSFLDIARTKQANDLGSGIKEATSVVDYGEQALFLAKQIGYAWVEFESTELLESGCNLLGEIERERIYRSDAQMLSRLLRDTII